MNVNQTVLYNLVGGLCSCVDISPEADRDPADLANSLLHYDPSLAQGYVSLHNGLCDGSEGSCQFVRSSDESIGVEPANGPSDADLQALLAMLFAPGAQEQDLFGRLARVDQEDINDDILDEDEVDEDEVRLVPAGLDDIYTGPGVIREPNEQRLNPTGDADL